MCNDPWTLTNWKEFAELIEALTTSGALLIAGVWAYFRFVRNRLGHPKAELQHEVSNMDLDENNILVHVVLTVVNNGDVLIPSTRLFTRIFQICPPGDEVEALLNNDALPEYDEESEFVMPIIGDREIHYDNAEIEPGESERFHFEFIIHGDIKTFKVYSYLFNEQKNKKKWWRFNKGAGPLGWARTTISNIN